MRTLLQKCPALSGYPEEAAAVKGFDFSEADADGDGVVSREEYETYIEQ